MSIFSWSFSLLTHTRIRFNPFWLSSCCACDFIHVVGASRRHRHTKDKLAFRFPLYLLTTRSYCRTRTLMNISDDDPPAKRRKSLDHQSYRRKSSPNSSPPRCPGGSPSPIAEIGRRWEEFTHAPRKGSGSSGGRFFDFSVMSYNILSQQLLHDNSYLYKHCSRPILDWNYRYTNIMKEIEEHNADILCLQEVQEDHYVSQIKPSLEALGYHCEYKKRTGNKPDGCAVVFKRDSFSLLSWHPVEYFRPSVPLLDRDNVGLVLLLQPKVETGCTAPFCVANTHLLYNPRRGDIKLAQIALLLAELRHVATQPDGSYCPVLVCGDLNSVPWSPLYRFLREGRLDYCGMSRAEVSGQDAFPNRQHMLTVPLWPQGLGISPQCQYQHSTSEDLTKTGEDFRIIGPCIEHSFSLSSAYSHHSSKRGQPEITTCNLRRPLTVDYIFYTAASRHTSDSSFPSGDGLQLLARLALFDGTDLHTVGGLPNAHNPSDHLPLLARFRLHSPQDQRQPTAASPPTKDD